MRNLNKSRKLCLVTLLARWGLVSAFLFFIGCETLDFSNPNSPEFAGASIQNLVTGIETDMRTELDIYIQATMTLGREGYFWEPADPRFTGELLFGPIDPGGFLSERPWSNRYRVIANCNELLNRAQVLSGEQKAAIEGFARTLRAYNLLMVLNYVDEDAQGRSLRTNFDGDVSKPFATKEQAFQFIEDDLNAANTALASAGSSFEPLFRLSAGFAGFDTPPTFRQFNRALAARVLVYRKKFNEALTALQESFLNPGGDLKRGVYHIYSFGSGDLLNPVFEVPTAAFVKLRAHKSFETDAEPGDLRFSSKTFKRATLETFDGLTTDLVAVLASGPTDPFPIIRNEELILLRAEANVGLGNFAAAEADMNIVRAAAGLPPYTGTDASNALFRLLHEKRYSLFGEGHRWVDVRRYGLLNDPNFIPIDRPARGDKPIARMEIPEDEFPED